MMDWNLDLGEKGAEMVTTRQVGRLDAGRQVLHRDQDVVDQTDTEEHRSQTEEFEDVEGSVTPLSG